MSRDKEPSSPPSSSGSPEGRQTVLGWVAELGLQSPRGVLFVALIISVAFGIYSGGTPINTSRHTMVAADNPHQAKQMAFFERFGTPKAMVLVISGADAGQRHAAIDRLTKSFSAEDELKDRVLAKIGPAEFGHLALVFKPELANELLHIASPSGDFAPGHSALAAAFKIGKVRGVDEQGYLVSSDGKHHFMVLFPPLPGDQGHEVKPFVDKIRALRDAAMNGESNGVEVRLTGPPVLAVDEQAEIRRGILTTSGITVLGILILLYLAFRSVRYTLLALVPVAVGVLATMGVARLIYGELNMVTSSCSSILLALGIDFGVFLLSRYGEIVREGASAKDAIRSAIRKAGAGLFIGALTTATAFLTTTTTEFTAYARLGVIVALGLLIMMASTLVLMPALLWVVGRGKKLESPEIKVLRVLPAVVRRGRVALPLLSVALLGLSLMGAQSLHFNTRFYDFLPDTGESAGALRLIEHDRNVSPLHATVSAEGIEDARELATRLRKLQTVETVQSPSDLLPPLDPRRKAALARLALVPAPNFAALRGAMPPSMAPVLGLMERAWGPAVAVGKRGHYEPSDLPKVFQQQYVSIDGKAVSLTVVPKGNIWDPEVARQFAADVEAVAPQATGMAMHVDAHLRMIREGFTKAAMGAAALVFALLLVSFRRVTDALLALVPTLVGFGWMLGAMALLDFHFDAANIVILPLILGIGVDAGVHLVHRMRQSAAAHKGVATLEDVTVGTGGAVALASITTLVGFASLMLADYGAMQSLGLAMTLGIGGTLVASLLLLPSLMVLLGRAR